LSCCDVAISNGAALDAPIGSRGGKRGHRLQELRAAVNGTTLPGLQLAADLGFVLCGASACFALLGIFLRLTRRHRPMIDSLSDHAYGIYFVHYVFVIWRQYLLLGAPLFAIAKGAPSS
jgi:hypothetical protein